MRDAWWRDAVVYQIYPRSFADSDADGVGDLAGITARLDHVAGLGADAIWLTPFQPSPQADHGYDVADYTGVDPLFGDLDAFDALLTRAHGLGLRVLIDVVPNHCSVAHPLFRAALAGAGRERFHFADGRGPGGAQPPNNWPSVFGGPAWTRVPDGQWYLHLYDSAQPDWNWDDPRTHELFDDVLRFWFDRGVDGLRIDVAYGMVKAPGLPDLPDPDAMEPMRLRANTLASDRPEVHDIHRRWRRIADSYDPPRVLVGEVNLPPARAAGYTGPELLHQVFAFGLVVAPWDARAWAATGTELLAGTPGGVTWVVENHDVVRTPTRYGSPARARAAILAILGLPGAAYLYQGQELGLPEVDVPPGARQDPAWVRSGMSRDGCRVPLPWTPDPPYGFSLAPPWLPFPPGWGEHAVESDPPALVLTRRALALRAALPFSPDDDVAWTVGADEALLAVRAGWFALVIAMGTRAVPLPAGEVLLASDPLTSDGWLPPDAAAWIRLREA
ncbi:alpha-amylase family glycosyl hydrolase [Actinoplanes sp. RD1]|uniref:alpha-amylase family glycosyl hydrolase n=1 Tax=Actinoplanes sp. RD1 TaxID=3064538 RepID=UPI0027415A32|nr:alpha-amylase family glycosyl hydrolase [Actinoplanes sp. RD1]